MTIVEKMRRCGYYNNRRWVGPKCGFNTKDTIPNFVERRGTKYQIEWMLNRNQAMKRAREDKELLETRNKEREEMNWIERIGEERIRG